MRNRAFSGIPQKTATKDHRMKPAGGRHASRNSASMYQGGMDAYLVSAISRYRSPLRPPILTQRGDRGTRFVVKYDLPVIEICQVTQEFL